MAFFAYDLRRCRAVSLSPRRTGIEAKRNICMGRALGQQLLGRGFVALL